MKTTFGRIFSTTVTILFLALILIGTTFQALVEDYLTESAVTELQQNSDALASLASAYSSEGSLLNRDFMVNLDVASRVSGADTIMHISGIWETPILLEAVEKAGGDPHIVLVHTSGIYSKHKMACEVYKNIEDGMAEQMQRMNITILRPTMIFGDMQRKRG